MITAVPHTKFLTLPRRGLTKVRGEWAMLCTAHKLLKLHKGAA